MLDTKDKEINIMRSFTLTLLIVLFLSSCNNFTSIDKYQLIASADGNSYRLDKTSGKIWMIKGNTMVEVQMTDLKLTIGERYKGADGYSFKYLGKGQVGEIDNTINDPLGIR